MFEKSRENLKNTPEKSVPPRRKNPARMMFILGLFGFSAIAAYDFIGSEYKNDLVSRAERMLGGTSDKASGQAAIPSYTDQQIADFAGNAYAALMTIKHPITLDAHMDNVRAYLTEDGYYSIQDAMKRGRIIDGGQDVSVSFVAAPTIVNKAHLRGTWTWTLKAPVNISYSTPQTTRVDPWDAMIVVQLKRDETPGIARISAIPR